MEKVDKEELIGMISCVNDVTQIDVSSITDISLLFEDPKTFNQDISGWDLINAIND